jgi:hypothetical protein
MGTYLTFFFFSMWKFMFTPLLGPASGLTFSETFFSCVSGGLVAAALFYYGSTFFMKRSLERHNKKLEKAKKNGKPIKIKRKFTRTNRWIIKIKQRVGIYGVTWIFPLFLSVPLGSIIVAKFYKHQQQTFILVVLFLVLDCLVITGLTYLFADWAL